MVEILYEDNHLLVVNKPVNIASQLDQSNDQDLLSLLKDYLVKKYNKPGDAYLGLIHRLDRPVGGVMVFAKTSKAASRLSDQMRRNTFTKIYQVVCEGEIRPQILEDYLIKDRKTNTSFVVDKTHPSGKYAKLEILSSTTKNNLSHLTIHLLTGRSHQIRVQLSSRNHPIWGDQRYNPHAKTGQQIALFASSLSFDHPTTKERLTFSCEPSLYPFI